MFKINSAKDLGDLIYKARCEQKLTQAQLASVAQVGLRFVRDLEKGKPTCSFDKALKVGQMLNIKLTTQ
ncbi:MAG: helix-turn-helix transcriptional regulator [Rickettsiales bacterium]|nr:helix-turn-helix transcriptional regulator [Rickettsiales bacterium]